jgi:hypothetical protein
MESGQGKVVVLITLDKLAMVGDVAAREWIKHRVPGPHRGVVDFRRPAHAASAAEGLG